MMILIFITILAATILTNGVRARGPMEPPMVNSVSNEFIVDDAFTTKVLNKYLEKLIEEIEDMDNWLKDGSDDTTVSYTHLTLPTILRV